MRCRFESYQACGLKELMISRTKKFFSEVVVEHKKVNWSTRQELVDATWVVLVSSAALGIFVGSCDFVLSKFLSLIIR